MIRALVLLLLACSHGLAHQFHVTADAREGGNGSRRHPWRLAAALAGPAAVRPGDTVWVHGGTYHGRFTSRLAGAASKPVIVRAYPGERVIVDGGDSHGNSILMIQGSYAWYWGLEIMSSDTVRISAETGSFPQDIPRGECVTLDQDFRVAGCKIINCVLHDGKLGFDAWEPALDTEVYGCVMFNNGWLAPDRRHGHNIYAQNSTGIKWFADNILCHPFSHNIQIYGSGEASIDNFHLEGNIVFAGGERNILVGGGRVASNTVIRGNYLYEPGGVNILNLGYEPFGKGADHATVTGNLIVGGELSFRNVSASTITGNTLVGVSLLGLSRSEYPDNTWLSRKPPGAQVVVRQNYYEPGRGNIVVFNWDGRDSVEADVSSVLRPGDRFAVFDAENYCGAPVFTGRYTGSNVSIPMTGRNAATPVGLTAPPAHAPISFGAFVITRMTHL